ncbi:MAG: outer membrane beta-barrel protein [Gemmatimonadaceae bacterium]
MFKSRTTASTAFRGFAAAGALTFSAGMLGAQGSSSARTAANTEGMVIGAQVGAAMISPDQGSSKTGFGAGALIGYGFNKNFALLVGFDLAKVDLSDGSSTVTNSNLTHLDFSVRYSFANADRAWVPYLNVAASGRGLSNKISGVDASVTGLGYGGGGGVQYFVNPNVALDLGLLFETGKFDKYKLGSAKSTLSNAGSSSTTRISFGVRYYPHIGTALHK